MTYTVSQKFVDECASVGIDAFDEIRKIWGDDVEIIVV